MVYVSFLGSLVVFWLDIIIYGCLLSWVKSAQNFEIRLVRLRQNVYNVKDRNQHLKKNKSRIRPKQHHNRTCIFLYIALKMLLASQVFK